METIGFGGEVVQKHVNIYTNDPRRPVLNLTLAGKVDKFATIAPNRVVLRGASGKPIRVSVSIVPEEKYPFHIVETRAESGKNIRFQLEEIRESNGKGYLLTVENLQTTKGRYFDSIRLKTDSTLFPEIKIGVFGDIFESNLKGGK